VGNQIYNAYADFGKQYTGAMTGYGNNQANLTTSAGNAAAAGQVGQANALTGGISNVSNMYYQNQMLDLLRRRDTSLGGAP
jgi:hypothetical protein